MIVFQAPTFQIDLSSYGVMLKEKSNLFNNELNKSYSLPFTINANEYLLLKLGLPTLENITGAETRVAGKLVLDDRHFPCSLFIGDVLENKLQCNLIYGNEDLAVYNTKLKDLPWPLVIVPSLHVHAIMANRSGWPMTPYNFPMLYKPELREETNYALFEGFVNNNDGTNYLTNEVDNSGAEPVYINRNVLAPFPYLLEILRLGYKTAGLKVFGDLFEDEILKKTLYIPKNHLEKFKGAEYLNFNFTTPTGTETIFNELVYGVYEKELVPTEAGSYEISYLLNLDPIIASYFEFNIFTEDALSGIRTNVFQALSRNNRVHLEDKFVLNVEAAAQYDPIILQLKLIHTPESIAAFTSFEYRFKGGQLNEWPTVFSLRDFMPEMTFGEFVNNMQGWLNLDVQPKDKYVDINFAQDSVLKRPRVNHEHLEVPGKKVSSNTNRLYKLSYANTEKVLYNKNGQIYSDLDEAGNDVIEIKMDLQPALVESNENVTTAVFPKDNAAIDFCVYEPLIAGSGLKPLCSSTLVRELFLQAVFLSRWEKWLYFRVNSKTFKESFDCSVHNRISTNELSVKYNSLHLLKSVDKKYKSEKVMHVEIESETF